MRRSEKSHHVCVPDLKVGDRTPWYEVVRAPEREDDTRYRVLVKHFDRPQHTDYVRGAPDEEVPLA